MDRDGNERKHSAHKHLGKLIKKVMSSKHLHQLQVLGQRYQHVYKCGFRQDHLPQHTMPKHAEQNFTIKTILVTVGGACCMSDRNEHNMYRVGAQRCLVESHEKQQGKHSNLWL